MMKSDGETGYLRQIRACNPVVKEPFIPWKIQGEVVGWLRPQLANSLQTRKDVFVRLEGALALHDSLDDFASRSEALHEVGTWLAENGLINPLMGELYPVTPSGVSAALCVIDRSSGAYFGIRTFGQHLNGYVWQDGEMYMWVGRRARDRIVFPGHLDNIVAGGLPYGIGLRENLLKEGEEEAGLPAKLCEQAVPVGVVTYNRVAKRGYRPDVLYCYDLELPGEFEPQNRDGEVESFHLMKISEVARLVRETSEFKLNCNLVVIDFLLRHGFIDPERPDYVALVSGLRQPQKRLVLADSTDW